MAKKADNSQMKKLLIGAAVVAVIVLLMPSDSGVKPKGKGLQFVGSSSKKKKTDIFEKEDYEAQFASLEGDFKNTFNPLVKKKTIDTAVTAKVSNGIPPVFTGGEGSWVYTGNMETNGTPNALLENTETGEGVFLKPGEKWKKMVLKEVRIDSIVISGEDGYTKTIFFAQNQLSPADPKLVATAPPQTGATNALTNPTQPQQDPNQMGGQGGGRRRRGQNSSISGPIGSPFAQIDPSSSNGTLPPVPASPGGNP